MRKILLNNEEQNMLLEELTQAQNKIEDCINSIIYGEIDIIQKEFIKRILENL